MPILSGIERSSDDVARLGQEILSKRVEPTLAPSDAGRFVAIDVDGDDFEIDGDDYTAVMKLRTRLPHAQIWLGRVGEAETYRIRRAR